MLTIWFEWWLPRDGECSCTKWNDDRCLLQLREVGERLDSDWLTVQTAHHSASAHSQWVPGKGHEIADNGRQCQSTVRSVGYLLVAAVGRYSVPQYDTVRTRGRVPSQTDWAWSHRALSDIHDTRGYLLCCKTSLRRTACRAKRVGCLNLIIVRYIWQQTCIVVLQICEQNRASLHLLIVTFSRSMTILQYLIT